MFYRWVRIKKVMAELWDPEDLTVGAGKDRLEYLYSQLVDDQTVRDRFELVSWALGEEKFQDAAKKWHLAVDQYIDRHFPFTKQAHVKGQIIEILEGRRIFLQ
jgi:hypothetical protein